MIADGALLVPPAVVIQSLQAAEHARWLEAHWPRVHKPVHRAVDSPPKKRRTISRPVRPADLPVSWKKAWAGVTGPVYTFATCVAHHESWHAGLWKALNPSGASGFGQWMPPTWQANAARAGVPVTRTALLSPPGDQVKVFIWMFDHHEQGAWRGTHCGYGT